MPSLLDFVLQQNNPRMAGLLGPDPVQSVRQQAQPNMTPVRASTPAPAPAPAPSSPGKDKNALQSILSGVGTVFTGEDNPNLTPEENARIRRQALLMSGLGTLAAEGTTAQRFAQGAMVGQQVGAEGRERAAAKATEKALMDAAPDVLKGMPEEQSNALMAILPGLPVEARQEILAGLALRQRESTLQKLSPGDVLFDPNTRQMVYQAPADAKPELDAMQMGVLGMMGVSGVKTQEDLAALPVEQRAQFAGLWDQIRRSTATQVSVGGEQAEVNALVKINADAFQQAQERGQSATEQINTISQVEALLGDTRTGADEAATLGLRRLGAVFGLDEEQVSQQEALRAFENRFALQARQNMPGQLSDNDIKFLKDSVVGLGKTKEANVLLAKAARRIAEAQLAHREEANRYVTQNGLMGLTQHMARWSSENRVSFNDLVADAKVRTDPFGDLGGN